MLLSFWVQIYNRLQSRMATVLIPLGFFVPDEDDEVMAVGETSGVDVGRNVLVLDEHTSDSWINVTITKFGHFCNMYTFLC